MIVDTSALLAFFDSSEGTHEAVRAALSSDNDRLVVSPYVLAEFDYLAATKLGVRDEITMLTDLASGAWDLASVEPEDLRAAIGLIDRYSDQDIGLADASNVVLADRYRTRTIATLDRRHFDVLRPLRGGRFSIVP